MSVLEIRVIRLEVLQATSDSFMHGPFSGQWPAHKCTGNFCQKQVSCMGLW
jgi:hypothetical protein